MRLSFLEPLYAEPGPFASVYLDTSRDVEHPERTIALRWQRLRESLSRQGSDRALLNALEEAVGADTGVPGVHGQAIFAAHGTLVLDGELPRPPERDSARYSTLPDAMPLVTQHVPEIPYMAVVVHYRGLPTAETHGWVTLEAETGTWPASTVTPGERLHRRVAVATWHHTSLRLGHRLDERARRAHADAVVVGGDEWACNVLIRRLPHTLRDKVVRVGGRTPPTPDAPCWSRNSTASSTAAWPRTTGNSWTSSSAGVPWTDPWQRGWPRPSPHSSAARSRHCC